MTLYDAFFIVALLVLFCWSLQCYVVVFCAAFQEPKLMLATLSFFFSDLQVFILTSIAACIGLQSCIRHLRRKNKSGPGLFEMDFICSRVSSVAYDNLLKDSISIKSFIRFMALPIVNTLIMIADLFVNPPLCNFAIRYINRSIAGVRFVFYGCFWYVIYIKRVSLHCLMNQQFREIRQAAKRCESGDLDSARRLINATYSAYHALRRCTGVLMAVIMLTATLHLMFCAIFTYLHIQNFIGMSNVQSGQKATFAFGEIRNWLQIFMYYATPMSAIGGANLEYLWKRFHYIIIKSKVEGHRSFWKEVERYAAQVDTLGGPLLTGTMLFAVIGVLLPRFLGIDVPGDKTWEYRYPYHLCVNETIDGMDIVHGSL